MVLFYNIKHVIKYAMIEFKKCLCVLKILNLLGGHVDTKIVLLLLLQLCKK